MSLDPEKFDKLVEVIVKQLDLKNGFSKKFVGETLAAIQRFDEKHTEKGLGDYGEFGGIGVAMKMSEKFNAIKRHYKSEHSLTPQDVQKTWEDCGVYSLMGVLVEKNEWKE